jgi:hypothetical protein
MKRPSGNLPLSIVRRGLPFVLLGLASCGPERGTQQEQSSQALASRLDLLSAVTCPPRNGRLVGCQIPPLDLDFPVFDTGVPLRTRFSVETIGNCASQFPLEIDLAAAGASSLRLRYLRDPVAVLRRSDGLAIPRVALTDPSPWTKVANLDASCAITLIVSPNEIDVDTREAAQAVMARLEGEVREKLRQRDRLGQLILFSEAYGFMKTVADSFHKQLSSDQMQELRSSALASNQSLERLILDCTVDLTVDQRVDLLRLHSALGVLGTPEAWNKPDGSRKSVADFLGPDSAKVLATVDELAARSGGRLASDIKTDFDKASDVAARAEAQLALAKIQLAALLGS